MVGSTGLRQLLLRRRNVNDRTGFYRVSQHGLYCEQDTLDYSPPKQLP